MQRSIGALVLSFTLCSCGGSPEFAGDYAADYMGQAVRLHLEENDGALQGQLSFSGLIAPVNGSISDGLAEGQVSAGLMGDLPFEARLQGDDGLLWRYLLPMAGQAQALELSFVRSDGVGEAEDAGQINPGLVGNWRRTNSKTVPGIRPSGNLNVATDTFCSLSGDGTFTYGGSVTGAAAPGFAGTTGAGLVTSGRWKTEGDVLFSQADGQTGWIPLGRYAISGNAMVLYVGNEKQLWERQ